MKSANHPSVSSIARLARGLLAASAGVLLASCAATPARGTEVVEGRLRYRVADGEATLLGPAAPLRFKEDVPAAVGGAPVTAIAPGAFEGCGAIRGIGLPGSLRSVGARAFAGCTNLTGVTLPQSVEDLGEAAFAGATHMLAVRLPESLRAIPARLCESSGVRVATFPEAAAEIGERAFAGCERLSMAELRPPLRRIGREAFADCPALGTVEIPETVESIGPRAFAGCSSLGRAVLPDAVPLPPADAFAGTKVRLDVAARSVGADAPEGARALQLGPA
ncbi:MAG: leucine-rich repeat domain-containing protein, partial [Kiritimatiellae bacterium]|nr:leucine-rich repeat domain-containing protein [Kiritimatiellia bacterium]